MDKCKKFLSDLVINTKYARYLPDQQRREVWDEIVFRNEAMHLKKFASHNQAAFIAANINRAYKHVYDRTIMPSMRSLQFSGKPIEDANHRIYNCAWRIVNEPASFHEIFYLLLLGVGVGYSVQYHHVLLLPRIKQPTKTIHHTIMDSIEGWADAVNMLITGYYEGFRTEFSYDKIRAKGTPLLTTGGFAPGPDAFRNSLNNIRVIMERAIHRKLGTLEVHDIICHLSDAVLSGGIRRAALLSIFSIGDNDMMQCKQGNFYVTNPQRARANNSVYLDRNTTSKAQFANIFKQTTINGTGEPGFIFTNDTLEYGFNPCCEISLRNKGVCNLVTIDVHKLSQSVHKHPPQQQIEAIEDVYVAAAFIATMQATYTHTPYLDSSWESIAQEEALLGVSMTGIQDMANIESHITGNITTEGYSSLGYLSGLINSTNKTASKLLCINQAKRNTCIKPEGSTSLVCGTSSGLHLPYSEYYIRRVRVNNNMGINDAMLQHNPDFIERDVYNPEYDNVVSVPVYNGNFTHHEADSTRINAEVNEIKRFNEWINGGHNEGDNKHNVSYTLKYNKENMDTQAQNELIDLLYENRYYYSGITIFPEDGGGNYQQMPFEPITKEKYHELSDKFNPIDFSSINEQNIDDAHLLENNACGGGSCEII